jgi:hypothetical protein
MKTKAFKNISFKYINKPRIQCMHKLKNQLKNRFIILPRVFVVVHKFILFKQQTKKIDTQRKLSTKIR